MDTTEDLSGRVLLKRILSTQTPQTPVTYSQSQEVGTSEPRRSSRQSKRRNAETKTPQDILRRSLRQNIRESITRKSQPPTGRRVVSVVLTRMSSSTSMILSDGATPRHLLRNILQTDPVKSPVVHETEPPKKPEPQSADKTATRIHPSTELSELELPDITIGSVASVAKGLSRKRPGRSLNVTAFEKRLKAGKDIDEGADDSSDDHSSLSLSSSTSLTLKTPFADVQTEKRGLQRKVFARRKVTQEDFGAAVSKRQMADVSSRGFVEGNLGEVTNSEGFTLGLSKLDEPDITADIVNCNTVMYDLPDAKISGFSIVSTQDKPSVMSSQLQDITEMEPVEELGKMAKAKTTDVFSSEEDDAASTKNAPEDVAEIQTEQSKNDVVDDAGVMSEEEEAAAESETSETNEGAESQEVEAQTGEEGVSDSHAEDDKLDDLTEEEEVSPDPQTEEEQGVAEAVELVADSESEDIESSHSEEEEDAQDPVTEHMAISVSFQGDDEAEAHSEDEEDVATSQTEDEYDEQREEKEEEEDQSLEHLEQVSSHISRRARRSEGALVVPVSEVREDVADEAVFSPGWSDSKSKAHTSIGLNASAEMENHDLRRTRTRSLVSTKLSVQDEDDVSDTGNIPAAGSKASFRHPELTQDIQVSEHKSTDSSEEDADQDELDDDLDENVEEFPCKTPAFVKEKKIFICAASPSVFKNAPANGTSEALPAAKPKQARQRKTRTASKKGVFPKSYLMSTFRHFAKTKVSADVYPVLNEIMDAFFDRMVEDLETYAAHANRKTIEFEDAVLLLKRQGHVNDKIPVEVLIEKYLRMEQRKILIPIATSGNVVVPKMR